MTEDFSFSILLVCCLCSLCVVVLAVAGAAIYFVMRKRTPEAPLTGGSVAPGVSTVAGMDASDPVEESFIPQTPPAPGKPADSYAAETMISPAPAVEPAADEKPENPFKPGSVAASSWNVGFDVRELYMLGFTEAEMHKFTQEEIQTVLDGAISLDELRKRYQGT
ncbi:MAG: hypothetical protein ACOYYS_00940 [Chloroflexota bacterium]